MTEVGWVNRAGSLPCGGWLQRLPYGAFDNEIARQTGAGQ